MANADGVRSKKNEEHYSEEFIKQFLRDKFGCLDNFPETYSQAEYLRGLNRLDEYFNYGIISSKRPLRKEFCFPEQFEQQIQDYLKKRGREGLSMSRLYSIKAYLERFSQHIQKIGVAQFSGLAAFHINSYIEYATQFTISTVSNSFSCLRGFLAYLHETGVTPDRLDRLLPQVRSVAEEMLPSAFTKDDVEAILKSVDRHNPIGKRDYAMLLLAARLGLRASDITNLRMSHLNWQENRIDLVQTKTKAPLSLPLLNEVGDAIIDYLKVRPDVGHPEVFLRADPPPMKLSGSGMYWIAEKYIRRAGIHIPCGKKHGPHSLRHSLSSIMLENRVPLPVISGILAHKSTETTKVYLKIDVLQLRECALDVPCAGQAERM